MKKYASKKMANGGMAGMPAQANKGGAMRGQARAAAMSGRTFANGGKVMHSKVVKSTKGK